jgi:hypothetical protein
MDFSSNRRPRVTVLDAGPVVELNYKRVVGERDVAAWGHFCNGSEGSKFRAATVERVDYISLTFSC